MKQTLIHSEAIEQYDTPSWFVTAIGVLLGLSGIGYVWTHPEPLTVRVLEVVLVSLPAASIVYGGYWLATHSLTGSDRWSIAIWSLVGSAVTAALVIGYILAEEVGGTVIDPGELVILGVLGGAVVSLYASILNERHHLTMETGSGDEYQMTEIYREPLSVEAQVLAELALDTRSWNVLRLLLIAKEPLSVKTIADRITTAEDADPTEMHTDLVHVRLPKLTKKGLIDYESSSEMVSLSDRIAEVANASEELATVGHQLSSEANQ